MSTLLTPELLAHIGGATPPHTEVATRRDIRKYAVATRQCKRQYLDGDLAPPLYHVALFWEVVALEELTPDGLIIDKFLPDFPLKKAMAGGIEIEYHDAIRAGDKLTATRTLTDIYEKQGRSGPLIFYEVTLDVKRDDGSPVISEKTTRILR